MTINCRCPGFMTENCRHITNGECPRHNGGKLFGVSEESPTNAMGAGSAIAGYSPFLFKHKKFKRNRVKLRKFRDVTK